ncbi:MAG: hypothetical protein Q8S73_26400 [Deltaproteobacteria bacterium]|nr:hypothetical protein [Myxococcales bacterium]MDP3217666.1 hypothetical protein [Deltaproteobacteria bacterium]
METVHRSEVAQLTEVIRKPPTQVSIVGVSGPGGVGKSFFIDDALAAVDPTALGYLRLRVDGSNRAAVGDLFALLDQLMPRSLEAPARPDADYFPQVRRVAAAHRALVDAVAEELGSARDDVKKAAVALLRAGHRLNETVPKTRSYLDVRATGLSETGVAATLDAAWDLLETLAPLRQSTRLPGPLRDLFGVTFHNRVRGDLYGVTADAMITDLTAALRGYRKEDWHRITHDPIGRGTNDLLLIVDDFEALAPTLEEFLVGALIPRLAQASFKTVLLIAGRDDLEAMSPSWAQHCQRYLAGQVRLAPFDRATALAMLESAEVAPERREAIFEATQGFPYLLHLVLDEAGREGADSALFLKKFHDRTTRWMNPTEQGWFVRVCYLDVVNEDTLARLFPAELVTQVQDWFEREPSIRDPAADAFRVRPLIRDKVLRYQALRSPQKHRDLMARAAED